MPKVVEDNWYAYPQYYDIAFRSETKREADFVEAAGRMYCDFPVRRLLEPGCGTGRLVRELAGRGYELTGFDLCRPALAYLRGLLRKRSQSAHLFVADLVDFTTDGPFDIAYCFCNTFRHLLTEEAARSHLQAVARSLRTGGLYLLGLHLFPPDADLEDCERWTETFRGMRVTTTFRVLKTDLKARREILRTNLCARTADRCVRVRSDYPMRIYSARQFKRLLDSVPEFELCDVYDFWCEIDHPLQLDDEISDTIAVLRKRP